MTRPNMKSPLMRLVVDGGATVLLLLALAYWWLGNLAHELAGAGFLALTGRHLLNNLYWWRALGRGRHDLRRRLGVVLTLMLAMAMAVLLGSSLAISRSLLGWLGLPVSFTLAEVHMFAAYWLMVIVGLHVGLNWNRVAALSRARGAGWRWGGWMVGAGLAAQGLRSAAVMDLWTRLRFDYSLVMWDFNEQAAAFFGHWLAIMAMFAVATHVALLALATLSALRLAQLGALLPCHSKVSPQTTLAGINRTIADATAGKPVFHEIHSDAAPS